MKTGGSSPEGQWQVLIHVLSGPGQGDTHEVVDFPAVVGRSQTCDVMLRDDPAMPTISRQHLRLDVRDGRITIEDLSSNGTRLDETPMTRGQITSIGQETVVWLGPATTISLELEMVESEPPEPEVKPLRLALTPTPSIRKAAPEAQLIERPRRSAEPPPPEEPRKPSLRLDAEGAKAVVPLELARPRPVAPEKARAPEPSPPEEPVFSVRPSGGPPPPANAELELRVHALGPVEVLIDRVAIPGNAWPSSQAFTTLVMLVDQAVASPQTGIEAETLARGLGLGRDRLNAVTEHLSQAFEAWPGPFRLPAPYVVQEGRLLVEPRFRLAYDVYQIEKLCARQESKSPHGWLSLLEQVAMQWRGPFLGGFKEPWARQRRKTVEAKLQEPIQKLSQIALEPAMRARVTNIYVQLLTRDPCLLSAHLAICRELCRNRHFDYLEEQISRYEEALMRYEGIKPSAALLKAWNEMRAMR